MLITALPDDPIRATADAGRLLHPSLYLAVFDPTLTLTEALEKGYTGLRLVNANGNMALSLALVMRQAKAEAAPAYDYDVSMSEVPGADVPEAGEVRWLTVWVEFPGFQRRVDVVRRGMEWSVSLCLCSVAVFRCLSLGKLMVPRGGIHSG